MLFRSISEEDPKGMIRLGAKNIIAKRAMPPISYPGWVVQETSLIIVPKHIENKGKVGR